MPPFIKKTKLTRPFLSVEEIANKETVFLQAMLQDKLFKENFYSWFEFYDKNRQNMHVFSVNKDWAEKVGEVLTRLTSDLHDFVEEVLELSNEELFKNYPMPGVSKERYYQFADYARWTYERRHRTIGSRYDFAIKEDGSIFIYEINADTPSMLFESMNLQNLMAEHLGNKEAQFNEIWGMCGENPFVGPNETIAVITHDKTGEDFGTVESIAQLAELGQGTVLFSSLDDLMFDPLEKNRSPFFLKSIPETEIDNLYVMLPWEEMLQSEMDVMSNWQDWCEYVNFFSPAWAWFLSHKFLLADFSAEMGDVIKFDVDLPTVFISSSRTAPEFIDYVSKPVVGRKSSAVTIHKAATGDTVKSKDNTYGDVPMVYQPLQETIKIDGASVMGCMWTYDQSAACLGFREFDGAILENENERVIMHQLVD